MSYGRDWPLETVEANTEESVVAFLNPNQNYGQGLRVTNTCGYPTQDRILGYIRGFVILVIDFSSWQDWPIEICTVHRQL